MKNKGFTPLNNFAKGKIVAKQHLTGFTLIEVLVVMTIIGVLASIVLVSFSGQRERAKLTKAQNFDAQVSHALGAYAVGIWRFEEGSGATLYDASGFDNDGTLGDGTCTAGNGSCPSWTSGVYTGTNALLFDGIDDYVDCGNNFSLNITDAITIEAWVKILSTANWARIVDKFEGGGSSPAGFNGYEFSASNGISGKPVFGIHTLSGDYYITSDDAISNNIWHHVAVTYSGSQLYLWIDGSESAASVPASGSILPSSINVRIGINAFDGSIDNVAIYDEAISAMQIQQHYAQGPPAHNIATK